MIRYKLFVYLAKKTGVWGKNFKRPYGKNTDWCYAPALFNCNYCGERMKYGINKCCIFGFIDTFISTVKDKKRNFIECDLFFLRYFLRRKLPAKIMNWFFDYFANLFLNIAIKRNGYEVGRTFGWKMYCKLHNKIDNSW